MTNDTAMMSDDDRPLASAPNVHVNGRNGKVKQVVSSDEDDIPLAQATPLSSQPPRQKRKRVSYKEESSSEDDVPLASSPHKRSSAAVAMPGAHAATTVSASKVNGNGKLKAESDADDDGTPAPPPKKNGAGRRPAKKIKAEDPDSPAPAKKKRAAPRKRKAKAESDEDPESEDDEKPAAPQRRPAKRPKKEPDNSDEPEGTPKPKRRAPAKKEPKEKKEKKKKEEEEQEPVFRWWEQDQGDGSVKWNTLEHNGPLPSSVKMKYNGKEVDLLPAAEEVAGFYAALIETDHAQDTVFNQNFFRDWKTVLKEHPPRDGTKIDSFEACDFRPMYQHFEAEKLKKKAMTAAEKKELKKQKDDMEAKYMTCLLDGRKEKIGNFRVEPPGLFRGRGEHPKKGALKKRVRPEDITLNIGKDAPVPVPNMPGKWKSVQHDNTVTWLANWTENINQSHKYVFLAPGSSLKGQSDMLKFEKARELKNHVDRIRDNYTADLRSKVMADRQRATAMYFIDKLALRAGNEKGEDEADTVGCCSLRCEHLTLQPPNFVIFDFLGKDSIRYYNEVEVDAQVFKNIRIFKEGKDDADSLFDRVNTSSLNKHLTNEMKGLTAKVFRTYNASITFQRLLDENAEKIKNGTIQEKLGVYNNANRLVAILCNHQRAAPKTHDQSMEKLRQKVKGLKYDRMKLRHALFAVDAKFKKKYDEDESDLDDDFVEEWETQQEEKEIEKAQKKFEKDNEKAVEEGKEPQERGTKKAATKGKSTDKLEDSIAKLSEKIRSAKQTIIDKDAGKEVALGTSKINYLDPRITAAWCKTNDVPIEKLFSKTLVTKFPWAMEVEDDWKF
ncbi:hypothetical protein CPB85DRAFT_1305525 [Mucidula mucida]|nr:hypothetical protein CPB85DRAFT_1305525 [Mucidula mucida]